MPDLGYFPRGESVLRRVHGARVVGVLYGQRALLLQATHALAFEGLWASSGGKEAPFRRLAHTAQVLERIYFGTREEADRELVRVRRLHARVRGTTTRDTGPHPAGSRYRADSPELLLWIMACTADSALVTYETFVRRLRRGERERFWQDYLIFGELFGLPRSHAPGDFAEFRDYMHERTESRDLHVLPEAREICHTILFDMPVPAVRRPALSAMHFAVIGLLPARVREMYGLDWDLGRQLAFEAMKRAHRTAVPAVPASIRRGSCAEDYAAVAREERRRLRPAA